MDSNDVAPSGPDLGQWIGVAARLRTATDQTMGSRSSHLKALKGAFQIPNLTCPCSGR